MQQQQKKGFTLIELLVVIAIIGILSAIGLVSLNGAREKARDAQRKSDLAQIRTALVLYYDEFGSVYPPLSSATDASLNVTGLNSTLVPSFLDRIPVSPTATSTTNGCNVVGSSYNYSVTASGNSYALWTRLEANNCGRLFILNGAGSSGECTNTATTALAGAACATAALLICDVNTVPTTLGACA